MAFDFYTLEGVTEIAETGEKTFNFITGVGALDTDNLVQETIIHLEQAIENYKDVEQDFLNTFHCKSLEEFAQKVERYYDEHHFTTFTGSSLKIIVDEYNTYKDKDKRVFLERAQNIYNNFLNNLKIERPDLVEDINKIIKGKPVADAVVEEVMNIFKSELSKVSTGTLKKDYHFTTKSAGIGKKILRLTASQGTEAFKNYVNRAALLALNQPIGNEKKLAPEILANQKIAAQDLYNISMNTSGQDNSAELNFTLKFIDLISLGDKLLKGTDVKNGAIDEDELYRRNSDIIQLITKELGLTGSYERFFVKQLWSMVEKDNTMFFTGKGVTNLEGILGEINAVVAITDLLGEEYTDKALNWIGSQTGTGSKQPSIDIVIDELIGGFAKAKFGIQVKNTTEEIVDLTHYVNFADKSLTTILENAGIDNKAIEALYISDTFNVPYKREGFYYKQVGYSTTFEHNDPSSSRFDSYTAIDKLIDNIIDGINIYLAQFAKDFIYMVYPDFKTTLATLNSQLTGWLSGNFCYIVGSKVYFANRMLQDLINQLKNLQSLKEEEQRISIQFETYFSKINEKGGEGYNIVKYKNSNVGLKKGKSPTNTLNDYTIKMRSSWGFS